MLFAFLLWLGLSQEIPDNLVKPFDYDAKQPLDIQITQTYEREGYKVYDLSYVSPLGGRVPAYLVVPQVVGGVPDADANYLKSANPMLVDALQTKALRSMLERYAEGVQSLDAIQLAPELVPKRLPPFAERRQTRLQGCQGFRDKTWLSSAIRPSFLAHLFRYRRSSLRCIR
jgi:hypothetical protein